MADDTENQKPPAPAQKPPRGQKAKPAQRSTTKLPAESTSIHGNTVINF